MRAKLVKQYIKIASECINDVCAHMHLCTCTCTWKYMHITCIELHVVVYMLSGLHYKWLSIVSHNILCIHCVYVTFSTECCRELKNYNTMFHILRSVWNIKTWTFSIVLDLVAYQLVCTLYLWCVALLPLSPHMCTLQWFEPWFSTEAEVYMGESSSQAQENNGCQYTYIVCVYMHVYDYC